MILHCCRYQAFPFVLSDLRFNLGLQSLQAFKTVFDVTIAMIVTLSLNLESDWNKWKGLIPAAMQNHLN